MGRIIAIAGNMGSGKTSLVDFLARRCGVQPAYEPNDENPYLADFYGDMGRWAFQSQLFFLTRKAEIHRRIQEDDQPTLLDRTIYEDAEIFARALFLSGHISERDYRLYSELYRELKGVLRPPDLLIFLRCPLKTLKKRIALRGRDMEQDAPDHYLIRLNILYGIWAARYRLSPMIKIHTDKIDYISDLTCQINLLKRVDKVLGV